MSGMGILFKEVFIMLGLFITLIIAGNKDG
jgi:hypothetical protein